MAKGDLRRAVLNGLAEFGKATLNTWFPKTYGHTALSRPLFGLDRKRKIARHTISSALWRLQRQGLVERISIHRQSQWRLTRQGRAVHSEQTRATSRQVPKQDGIARLVIFDIPEREREKRTSIRTELVGYGFQQLQKSVWIGRCPLPKDFLELIDALNLSKNIHIFSIRERGTIEYRES